MTYNPADRFWLDDPAPVLMVENILVQESICSHGKVKVIAEEVRINMSGVPLNARIPVKELVW